MPYRRRARKSNRPLRRRRNARARRARMFNPKPMFTETYKQVIGALSAPVRLNANQGGTLKVQMSDLPQLDQYRGLYQKYRILKAQFICLATYDTTSADVNAAQYNATLGGAAGNAGMSRIVFAVNDTPNPPAVASETQVLTQNGCKIVTGKGKIVITCRPVPEVLDANGVILTQRGKFINFDGGVDECPHYGINWWHTSPQFAGSTINPWYEVYVKLTFQLADPR